MWKQRKCYKSIEEYVIDNTGQSIEEYNMMPECPIENIAEGVKLLHEHVGKPVYVLADYDVDGVTSGFEMYLGCKCAGLIPHIRFPKRFSEGYGFSDKILEEILEKTEPQLIILVDNGIVAYKQIKRMKEAGYTVLVVDHHVAKAGYPDADVVIDQSDGIKDESVYGYTPYCAAGLTLRFFEKYNEMYGGLDEISHNTMKVTAGIATVADVVPMKNGNRKIVKEALEIMNNIADYELITGVKTLITQLGIEHFTTTTIGFNIAPMLNAPGRLEDAGALISATMLASKNIGIANSYFKKVLDYNELRKDKSRDQVGIAEDILIKRGDVVGDKCTCKFIVVASEKFDKGICGIIAGKLCEKYQRPAIVMNVHDGIAHGSARSTDNINLVNTLKEIEELFLGFGGHAKAAGMSSELAKVEIIRERLNEMPLDISDDNDIFYDFEVEEADFSHFIEEAEKYAPYGEGNPIPTVYVKNYVLYPDGGLYVRYMGKESIHVKLFGADSNALCFGMAEEYLKKAEPKNVTLIGNLSNNYFNGSVTPQIEVKAFESVENKSNELADELSALLTAI